MSQSNTYTASCEVRARAPHSTYHACVVLVLGVGYTVPLCPYLHNSNQPVRIQQRGQKVYVKLLD
jgi:hypothetical protein